MKDSLRKSKRFSGAVWDLPKTLEEFQRRVEERHAKDPKTSENQNRYEVRFVSNKKK